MASGCEAPLSPVRGTLDFSTITEDESCDRWPRPDRECTGGELPVSPDPALLPGHQGQTWGGAWPRLGLPRWSGGARDAGGPVSCGATSGGGPWLAIGQGCPGTWPDILQRHTQLLVLAGSFQADSQTGGEVSAGFLGDPARCFIQVRGAGASRLGLDTAPLIGALDGGPPLHTSTSHGGSQQPATRAAWQRRHF